MSNKSAAKALHDTRTDLRAFVVARHPTHGTLLLQANKAKKGGLHYQLPGGHVDQDELDALGPDKAAKAAAARELFEETGIDVRTRLGRLQKVPRVCGPKRTFYVMDLRDTDAVGRTPPLPRPMDGQVVGSQFTLKLSHEHTGFTFEPELEQAADLVIKHSGGHCSTALRGLAEMLRRVSPRQPTAGKKKVKVGTGGGGGGGGGGDGAAKHEGGGGGAVKRDTADDLGGYSRTSRQMSTGAVGSTTRLTVAEEVALAELEREEEEIRRAHRADAVSSDCCGMNCYGGTRRAPVKVDPKTYFANERTFLSWMHTAATLGSFGMLTFNVAQNPDFAASAGGAKWIGLGMICSAMVMILYSIISFHARSQLVRRRAEGPYEMSWGPAATTLALTGIFGALIAVWWQISQQEGGGGGGGHGPAPSPSSGLAPSSALGLGQ